MRREAWETAFARHYVGVCEYALRLVGSAEAAQDLVQDLFLHLWDTRGPRDAVRLSPAYLYVAVRNRALKHLRRRRVAEAWIERAAREEPPATDTPEDRCLRDEVDRAARRAIADLPDRCREIFLLRRRDHWTYQRIAASLQLSLGTVKAQMWRANVRLEHTLAPYPPQDGSRPGRVPRALRRRRSTVHTPGLPRGSRGREGGSPDARTRRPASTDRR